MAGTCKVCGVLNSRTSGMCVSCAVNQGLCTRCQQHPARPGWRSCVQCYTSKRDWLYRIEARTGIRHGFAKWQIDELEQNRKFAAELVGKFREDLATANG